MKTHRTRNLTALALALFGSVLLQSPAQALLINFNDYTAGSNLAGQPSSGTQWSGGGSDFVVTAGAGVSASNAVVTAIKASGNSSSLFSPSALDLPNFNGASSILEVGFQFRFATTPDASTSTVAAIQFGYDGADANTAARFYLRADGVLGFNDGATARLTSLDITDTTTWSSISASLNYATQTYTFSINGTPYSTGGGVSVFAFRGATDSAGIRLNDNGSANSKSIVFDNISANVVPEPSVTALIGISALLGVLIIRRKTASCHQV